MSTKPKRLTTQQHAFVRHYSVDFNATKAAEKAGYSAKSASRLGHELLKHPLVQAELKKIFERTARSHEELRFRVIKQLMLIAFSNIKNYGTFDSDGLVLTPSEELDDDVASAIQEFKVTKTKDGKNVHFKLAPKERALEMLARHLGLFADIQEKPAEPFVIHVRDGSQILLGARAKESA